MTIERKSDKEKLLMDRFIIIFLDVSCPLLESDLAYSDDDIPSMYENGLSEKPYNQAKENLNFLHLNRYVFLANECLCKCHKKIK